MRMNLSAVQYGAIAVVSIFLASCNSGGSSNRLGGGAGPLCAPVTPAVHNSIPNGVTPDYDVEITRTCLGIPHIKANDYASLGYGYGYAHAEDNLCVLQEDLVTIRGERAKYFGETGSHVIVPNGSIANNVDSDFFWKFMATDEAWTKLKNAADPELLEVTQGFVDGYNRYLNELKDGLHPGRHADCATKPWLTPITEADMYRRYYRLAIIASSSVFVGAIANLGPPPPGDIIPNPLDELSQAQMVDLLRSDPGPLKAFMPDNRDKFGSNMYALSSDATETGQSIVFGNPHFPWTQTERLYISHLQVPESEGRPGLDIMGSSLYGVPAVLIGFTDHFAWSHTVSTAFRFTIYELTLNPLNPTQYLFDGEGGPIVSMTPSELSVEVLKENGDVEIETRTLWRSHYGPMMTIVANGIEVLPWTHAKAYTMRDANAENDRLLNQFARWNTAKSLDEFIHLHKTVLGIPWVNTVASGPNGKAYYGDVSVVPHVTNAKLQTCAAHPIHDIFQQLAPGLPVLDGARAACAWGDDTDNPDEDGVSAPVPGIFGPKNLPTLQRDDWVHNCNDSYWLTHPQEPLTGYAGIIGAYNGLGGSEQYARSLRTRLCIQHVLRHLDQPGADGLGATFDANGDKLFTLKELQDTVLASQIYSAQLARDAVVADVCPQGTALGQAGPVEIDGACTVLANWDLTANRNAFGTHIWREFWRKAAPNPIGIGPNPTLWTTPFSASDPVNTPRGLNTDSPQVQASLADAIDLIQLRGHALEARFGTLQKPGAILTDPPIEIFGGEGFEGAFTIANSGTITTDGYKVMYGNSYIQTVTWAPDGDGFRPVAEGFVTYSQSTDPASPHYADFTREYSAKRWYRFPFRPAEIEEKKISRIRLLGTAGD
jgi:acyl-homoserine-lactone acylase